MLKWAIVFGIVAIVAAVLGFWALAGVAAAVAKILFGLFIVGLVVVLLAGIWVGRRLTH